MKYKLLIIIALYQMEILAQTDSTFHSHLLVKIAPFMYLGLHGAIQLGLETNLTPKTTIGFDYAYGDSKLVAFQKNGAYIDGEVSHRYRLEMRWYKKNFAETRFYKNSFSGIEIFNRTNYYPSTTTIGRYCQGSFNSFSANACSYYEKLSDDTVYQVWGIFYKFGSMQQKSKKLWVEWYGGLGISSRSNTIGKYTLGPNDHLFTNESPSNNNPNTIFDFHKATNLHLIGPDLLFSLKLDYQLF